MRGLRCLGCLGCLRGLDRGSEGRRRGGCLRRRGEARRGAGLGLRLLLDLRLVLLGDLAAEVLEQGGESAVEALADGGEAPHVLEVEVAEHHRPLGAELRAREGVPDDFLAAGHDPDVTRADLRHLSGAVDRGGEGQLVDARRNAVQRHPEGLGVAGLRAELLNGLLRRLRLVVEDEVAVVRQLLVGVESEAADVEGESGAGDLDTHVQIGACRQIADLGLVTALEFPGHT
ncbi:hypothetical protein VR46_21770 [Streptomyces sp. NRRL S-444]|nr:hypothetical protein VR46_21770 [Streptomyces sp. NRRL S-444]